MCSRLVAVWSCAGSRLVSWDVLPRWLIILMCRSFIQWIYWIGHWVGQIPLHLMKLIINGIGIYKPNSLQNTTVRRDVRQAIMGYEMSRIKGLLYVFLIHSNQVCYLRHCSLAFLYCTAKGLKPFQFGVGECDASKRLPDNIASGWPAVFPKVESRFGNNIRMSPAI